MNITKMSELVEVYRDLVNEYESTVVVQGMEFDPAVVLEELDPIAFRQGYLEYANVEGIDVNELEDDL